MIFCQETPFVTVIVPVRNEEKYISLCLESVFRQNYPHDRMEVLVVDNGSTDGTPLIAEKYFLLNHLGRVISKESGTIASVRNYGWRHARGEILAFLDGDSTVDPDWLGVAIGLFLQKDQTVCIGFSMAQPHPKSHWLQHAWYDLGNSSRRSGTKSVEWLSSFNLVVKRSAFEKIDGFNEALTTGEDQDLGIRLNQIGEVLYSDRVKVAHLDGVTSIYYFLKKEFWRGAKAGTRLRESSQWNREFLSVLIPFLYFLMIIYIVVAMLYKPFFLFPVFFVAILILVLSPAILVLYRGIWKPLPFLRGYAFYGLYLFSRGAATFYW